MTPDARRADYINPKNAQLDVTYSPQCTNSTFLKPNTASCIGKHNNSTTYTNQITRYSTRCKRSDWRHETIVLNVIVLDCAHFSNRPSHRASASAHQDLPHSSVSIRVDLCDSPQLPLSSRQVLIDQYHQIVGAEVSSHVLPFLPRLQSLQVLACPSFPKLARQILDLPPSSPTVVVGLVEHSRG